MRFQLFTFILSASSQLWAYQEKPTLEKYHRAWELTGQLRFTEAIPQLQALIAGDRYFERAYLTLGDAYCWSKRFDEGERYFLGMAHRDQASPMPYLGLAWLNQCRGNTKALNLAAVECIVRSAERWEALRCYEFVGGALLQKYGRPPQPADFNQLLPPSWRNPARHLGLVMMMLSQGRQREAIEIADEGIRAAMAIGHSTLEAHLRETRATTLLQLPGPSSADVDAEWSHAERLFHELGDRDKAIQTGKDRAYWLVKLGDSRGREKLDALLQLARSWGHTQAESSILLFLAMEADQNGDTEQAIDLYKQSAALSDPVQPWTSFTAYERMGHCYRRSGNYAKAVESYQTIGSIVGPDNGLFAFMPRYLGDVHEEIGNYWQALAFHQQSLAIFRKKPGMSDRNRAGATMTRIGRIYALLGDYARAEEQFRGARAIARQTGDPDPMQRLLSEWGAVYLKTQRFKQALAAYQEVRRLGEHTRNMTFQIPAVLGIGRAQVQLGQTERGMATLREALALAERHGVRPLIAETQLELARTLVSQRKPAEARMRFEQALQQAAPVGLLHSAVSAREGLADLSDEREAIEHVRAAIGNLEQLRNQIPGPNLRASFASQTWQVYQKAIRLLLRRHRVHPQAGFDREAFHFAERGRSRAFLDLLSEAVGRNDRRLSPLQRAQKQQLANAVSKLAAESMRGAGPTANRALEEAERKLQAWITDMHVLKPELRELHYPEALDLTETQAAFQDNATALVSFVLDEPRSHAFVVTRSVLTVVSLAGQTTIEAVVKRLRDELSVIPKGTRATAYEQPAAKLYALVMAPLEPALRGRSHLILIPDGSLHHVAFETLLKNSNPRRYLVQDFVVAYAPSASVYRALMAAQQRRSGSQRRALLAYGDPTFEGESAASAVRAIVETRGRFRLGALPNTRVEVTRISALFPKAERTTYLGADASEEVVKEEPLTGYRQVHFATHALIDERFPLRSGIVLSPGIRRIEDGLLTLAEIHNLELNADLVVLSACQSGLGALVRGEGLVGLTRSLFSAGTSRVAVSLWNVNDVATVGLMENFYKEMRAGKTPAAALRAAKLDMIGSGATALRHPHFWAPFILSGIF